LAGQAQETLAVGSLAAVKPERLLIKVTKQVERFNADIGSFDGPLQKRPEIFDPISVNQAVNVLLSVVDYTVGKSRLRSL
jgi:S-adenosylmethionine hydrolase